MFSFLLILESAYPKAIFAHSSIGETTDACGFFVHFTNGASNVILLHIYLLKFYLLTFV